MSERDNNTFYLLCDFKVNIVLKLVQIYFMSTLGISRISHKESKDVTDIALCTKY